MITRKERIQNAVLLTLAFAVPLLIAGVSVAPGISNPVVLDVNVDGNTFSNGTFNGTHIGDGSGLTNLSVASGQAAWTGIQDAANFGITNLGTMYQTNIGNVTLMTNPNLGLAYGYNSTSFWKIVAGNKFVTHQ